MGLLCRCCLPPMRLCRAAVPAGTRRAATGLPARCHTLPLCPQRSARWLAAAPAAAAAARSTAAGPRAPAPVRVPSALAPVLPAAATRHHHHHALDRRGRSGRHHRPHCCTRQREYHAKSGQLPLRRLRRTAGGKRKLSSLLCGPVMRLRCALHRPLLRRSAMQRLHPTQLKCGLSPAKLRRCSPASQKHRPLLTLLRLPRPPPSLTACRLRRTALQWWRRR